MMKDRHLFIMVGSFQGLPTHHLPITTTSSLFPSIITNTPSLPSTAASCGHRDVALFLIKSGASSVVLDSTGQSPVDVCDQSINEIFN